MNKELLVSEYERNMETYQAFSRKIEHLLTELLHENSLNYHSISQRVKSIDSLEDKIIRKQQKYQSLSEITDICGIRIITYYSDEVDVVAKLIEEEFLVDRENSIDKRKMLDPDRFGYLSLHYVVKLNEKRASLSEYINFSEFKIEIQIRTILQHTWAEIEHDLGYKTNETIPRDIKRDFFRLASLLELADKEFINIRCALNHYTDFVQKEIATKDKYILIDNVSIKTFLETNPTVINLAERIAKSVNLPLYSSDSSVGARVVELKWLGWKTINDVTIAVHNYSELAHYLAVKKIKNSKKDIKALNSSIGLYYICYCKLLEDHSVSHIVSFLNDNGIAKSENKEVLARELIAWYDEYNESQNTVEC